MEDVLKRAFGYRTEQRKRSENQDSFGVFDFEGFTLAIVCDGMGGHVGGAQASTLAVRTMHEVLSQGVSGDYADALRNALERANQAIYEAARKNHRLMGMGTTAVAAILSDDGFVHIAHVGDSRAYLINEGQAIQVTRDHTMVNLFVDAELLTPEDAATHPEAHVLSRSLGVERQVEVEVSEPIELADNDVVFLCSDGIHGVVTDWELGSVEWSAPEGGVTHVIDIVEAREGDDNATAIAVLIGDAPSMGVSPLPDPKSLDASAISSGGSHTIVPEDDPYESVADPESQGTEPSAPSRQQAPLAPSLPNREDAKAPTAHESAPPQPLPKKSATPPVMRRRIDRAPTKKRGNGVILLGLAGVGMIALAALGAVYVFTRPTPTTEGGTLVLIEDPVGNPPATTDPVVPVTRDLSNHLFVAKIPDSPRRLPHRPLRYTQPPPGGAPQFQAVQAARDRKCAKSLDAVQRAMNRSPDHAKLYSQAWFCFAETHSRPLRSAEVETFERFAELETQFRGWPEPGEGEISWGTEDQRVPMWYRPALDGIEYRLEAWARSTEDDLFREVMIDLSGEPTVSDDLAADLLVEAQAAVALSQATERDAVLEESWARRVYVVAAALDGRVGRMLRTHRPELVPQLDELLEKATTTEPGGRAIPQDVTRALRVGRGDEDAPTVRIGRPTPGPAPLPDEPDLGSGNGSQGTSKGSPIYK